MHRAGLRLRIVYSDRDYVQAGSDGCSGLLMQSTHWRGRIGQRQQFWKPSTFLLGEVGGVDVRIRSGRLVQFTAQGNRTASLSVTAVDEAASPHKRAHAVIGIWPLSDLSGDPAPAATPSAFNTLFPGRLVWMRNSPARSFP